MTPFLCFSLSMHGGGRGATIPGMSLTQATCPEPEGFADEERGQELLYSWGGLGLLPTHSWAPSQKARIPDPPALRSEEGLEHLSPPYIPLARV